MNNKKLTSIRGVACLIVAIWHSIFMFSVTPGLGDFLAPFGSEGPWVFLHQIMMMMFSGEAAVVVFFVLSGCVLSIQLSRLEVSSPVPYRTYYVRRFFRIYPMVIASVLVTASIFALVQHFQGVRSLPLSSAEYLDQSFSKIDLVKNILAWDTKIDPPLWSLKVEIELSIAFPLIYIALTRPKALIALLIVSAIAVCIESIGHMTVRRSVFAFVIGATLPRFPKLGRSLGRAETPIVVVSIAVLMVVRRILEPLEANLGSYVVPETLAAFFIIRAAFFGTVRMSILEWRPLAYLGEISYSYYVLHFPVMWTMLLLLWDAIGPAFPTAHPIAADILLATLTSSVTFVVAELTYKMIEMPFHELGRRWTESKPR